MSEKWVIRADVHYTRYYYSAPNYTMTGHAEDATVYPTRDKAESECVLLCGLAPDLVGNLSIVRYIDLMVEEGPAIEERKKRAQARAREEAEAKRLVRDGFRLGPSEMI